MEDFVILALGAGLIVAWVVAEFWDYLCEMWESHIVADYPYEDDL